MIDCVIGNWRRVTNVLLSSRRRMFVVERFVSAPDLVMYRFNLCVKQINLSLFYF